MENNEIYIDGVNVAGCKFLEEAVRYNNNAVCSCPDVRDCEGDLFIECCGEKPSCYYKQLKRAEIEIKKLKGIDGSVHPDSVYYKITRLEQENKELKEKFKQVFNIDNQECWDIAFLNDEKYKYRSALEEIREELCYGRTFFEGYFDSANLSRTDKIIKKINEVLK